MTETTHSKEVEPVTNAVVWSRNRLIFSAISLMLCGLLGFIVPVETGQIWVRYSGYFFTLASVCLFIYYAVKCYHSSVSNTFFRASRNRLIGAGFIALGAWILFLHGSFDYKIAMDDYLLSATAKTMHSSREIAYTEFGRNIGNAFTPIQETVDKRPWLYPFLVATGHDLIGYHPTTAFYVNAVLGVGFLGLVFYFGLCFGGILAGGLSVLLWVSMPLLSHNAMGSGMEMLNLFCLQAVLVLSIHYLRKPTDASEGLLSLGMLLVANTRYESGLFALPVLIIIAIGWYRSRRVFLSWGSIASLILLLPSIWQLRVYGGNQSAWEMSSVEGSPFGWNHLVENWPHALSFFFDTSDTLGNSFLISAVGAISLIAFFIIHLLVMISFHSGKLDARFVSRYSLPFHVVLVSCTIALLTYISQRKKFTWGFAICISLIFIHSVTLPTNSKAIPTNSNFLVRELNWLSEIADQSFKKESLIIDSYTVQWALEERSALSPQVAWYSVQRLAEEVSKLKYTSVYLVERVSLRGGEFKATDQDVAQFLRSSDSTLLAERSFRPLYLTRVYRLENLPSE